MTVHAEEDAIGKLPPLKGNQHRRTQVDLFVMRTSLSGKIGMSQPCTHCLEQIATEPMKKGYIIKNIYYTDETGSIIKTTLNKLMDSEQHVSRHYRYFS